VVVGHTLHLSPGRPWDLVEAKPFGPEIAPAALPPRTAELYGLLLVTAPATGVAGPFSGHGAGRLYAAAPEMPAPPRPPEGASGWLTTFGFGDGSSLGGAPSRSHPLFRAFHAPQPIELEEESTTTLALLMARLTAETTDRWDGWESASIALLQLILVEASNAAPRGGAFSPSRLAALFQRGRRR
jgi:hypothetical protein